MRGLVVSALVPFAFETGLRLPVTPQPEAETGIGLEAHV